MKIITPEQVTAIQAMRANQVGYRTIAKALGIPTSTVRYWADPDKAKRDGAARKRAWFSRHPMLGKINCYRSRKLIGSKTRDFQRRVAGHLAPQVTSTFTLDDVLDKVGNAPCCYLSGRLIDINQPETYAFDHIVPVAQGGENTLANLGLLHADINRMKSDKTPDECIAIMIEVLTHHGYVVSKKMEEGNAAAAYPTEESPRFEGGVKTA